jgi:hypothetical protein
MKRKPNPNLFEIELLECNLEKLSCCCGPVDGLEEGFVNSWVFGEISGWPSKELLLEIENAVLVLAQGERKNPIVPVWKAFLQVDRRRPKLRLKSCTG